MDINLNFGGEFPLNSITNPNVSSTDYLDANTPFDFFQFLRNTKTNLPPSEYNNLYLNYINEWNIIKNNTTSKSNDVIRELYVSLLKEITLNYFTLDEKRFISKIDFNDPLDLDIVLPFYSKKIVEICDFYAKKRESLKFSVKKNNRKGTDKSLVRSIHETITDYLFSYDETLVDKISEDFDIEIEELFDMYQNYLDIDPNIEYDVKNELRKELYSSNINTIETDLFININSAIKKQILNDINTFLISFRNNFTINYNINDIDLNCKVGDKLYEFVTLSKDKATKQVVLRNQLIRKYIGTDYYYITVGNTVSDVVSGKLFEAENPTGNLLNRHFPTTATIEEDSELHSIRKIGLLFTPDKNSILYFSAPEKRVTIDNAKLKENTVYIFPDPAIYSNAEGLTKYDPNFPLIHTENYEKSIKDPSYNISYGDNKNTPDAQDFHGYRVTNQLKNTIVYGESGIFNNFLKLGGIGTLYKHNNDVYGNLFGLFKQTHKESTLDLRTPLSANDGVEILYGGIIKFDTHGQLPELVKPTSPSWVYPNVWSSEYYYNVMIDAGIGRYYNNAILERGTDPYPGDLTLNYVTSSIQYKEIDGGFFNDLTTFDYSKFVNTNKPFFINQVLDSSKTVILSSENNSDQYGGIYLKKSNGVIYVRKENGDILPLSAAFSQTYTKYLSSIQNELTYEIIDFNVYGDTIWFKTTNYLIFEKIIYDGLNFKFSDVTENYVTYTQNASSMMISDPFIFENREYAAFCKLELLSGDSYDFCLIPKIYFVSRKTLKVTEKYPKKENVALLFKNEKISNVDNQYYLPIKVKKINSVSFTYNTRNNKYAIVGVVEDQNEMFYVFKSIFTYDGEIFHNETSSLSYIPFPVSIKTLLFNRLQINDIGADFSKLNTVYGSISSEILSGGELKLYA